MKPARTLALAVIVSAALAGCAKETTRYGDSRGVETVTNQFGSTDLQLMAESMARSMNQAPIIASANLPIVTVQEVRNKTTEYIDTRAITDSIRSELQKGGKVRFAVDSAAMNQQTEEIKRQQGVVARFGNMLQDERVDFALPIKIVVEKLLTDTRFLGDLVGGSRGEAFRTEFFERDVEYPRYRLWKTPRLALRSLLLHSIHPAIAQAAEEIPSTCAMRNRSGTLSIPICLSISSLYQ